jgi:hypothetical protein
LDRISSSNSIKYSQLGQSSFQRVYVAFAANSDLCLSFLVHCADYREKVIGWRFPSIASPAFSRVPVGPPHDSDLRERTTGLWFDATGISTKSFETLGGMDCAGALLRGLGTHPTHGLSTGTGVSSTHLASPDLILQILTSRATDNDLLKPGITITPPAGELQGLQRTVSLGGSSGVSLPGVPAALQSSESVYRASIEDRRRIFGQSFLPRRPNMSLLQIMWLVLNDKALVSSKRSSANSGSQLDGCLPQVLLLIYAIGSLLLDFFQDFSTTCRSSRV